jgi:hypothetical protein
LGASTTRMRTKQVCIHTESKSLFSNWLWAGEMHVVHENEKDKSICRLGCDDDARSTTGEYHVHYIASDTRTVGLTRAHNLLKSQVEE